MIEIKLNHWWEYVIGIGAGLLGILIILAFLWMLFG